MASLITCCAGEQQRAGVVQHGDADVLQRAVPARLPGAGRVLRQCGPARQRPGVLPRGHGPADPGAGGRAGRAAVPAVRRPVRRGLRVRGHVARCGLLQEERGQDQHVPGGHRHGRRRVVRAVHLPVAHPVGPVVRRSGRGRSAGRQGAGRLQRGRRAHSRAPRLRQRSDTQPGQVYIPIIILLFRSS